MEVAADSGNWVSMVEDSLSLMGEATLAGNLKDAQEFIKSWKEYTRKAQCFHRGSLPCTHSKIFYLLGMRSGKLYHLKANRRMRHCMKL